MTTKPETCGTKPESHKIKSGDGDHGQCTRCKRWFFKTCTGYWQEIE